MHQSRPPSWLRQRSSTETAALKERQPLSGVIGEDLSNLGCHLAKLVKTSLKGPPEGIHLDLESQHCQVLISLSPHLAFNAFKRLRAEVEL